MWRVSGFFAFALSLLVAGNAAAAPLVGQHPRFLLGAAQSGLVTNYAAGMPEVKRLVARCDAQAGQLIPSGYQGWDWAYQMSDCALAWYATSDPARAQQAVTYWRALLDDRYVVGDGLGGVGAASGGMFIACQDSGYSMRTFGAYGALGLDWLFNAPGVDTALRALATSRVAAWGDWYENGGAICPTQPGGGYLNDTPTANYFAGYLFATWAAAIAVDDPVVGPILLARAQALTQGKLVPALSTVLAGGDQYEGWQYGEVTAASYALTSAAAAQNGLGGFADAYMHDVIALHLYGMHPGDKRFFDSGDHGSLPMAPGSQSMWAALISNPTDSYAPYARQYLALASPGGSTDWTGALAEAMTPAGATIADYRVAGLPLSYYAAGTGTVLARSGWGDADTWASLQAAGRGAPDHQHCDAGHFELSRGDDDLAITTAGYGTYATWNNNTLLFDDGNANLTYSPNQGPDARPDQVAITRYAELDVAVAAQAEFAHAYDNQNGGNSVSMARRDWIFVRPDLLVVSDRATLTSPTVKASFPLHTSTAPVLDGAVLTVDVGGSRLTSTTLLPAAGMASSLIAEPDTSAGSAPWSNNDPWAAGMYRRQETVSGATSASFLHALVAGAGGTAAPASTAERVGGAYVVRVDGAPSRVVVVSAAPDGSDIPLPLTYKAPAGVSRHVLSGLVAAPAYRVSVATVGADCMVTVEMGTDPTVKSGDHSATFELGACAAVQMPGVDGGAPDMQPAATPDLSPPFVNPVTPPADLSTPLSDLSPVIDPTTPDLAERAPDLRVAPQDHCDLSPVTDLGSITSDLADHGDLARPLAAEGRPYRLPPVPVQAPPAGSGGCSVGGGGGVADVLAILLACGALLLKSRRRKTCVARTK